MKKDSVEVSYIIPSFNHAQYITECLESIKSEISDNDEILVLDDGSNDESIQKIEEWQTSNPSLNFRLMKQDNVGICATLNRLVQLALGKYIRIVSSDDMVIKGSTSKLVKTINASTEYKLAAFGDTITINGSGKKISNSHISFLGKKVSAYRKNVLVAIITNWAIAGPSILLRKNFDYEVGKYNEDLLIEDWNMYLRLAANNKIAFCDETVALYRVHQTNTSITKDIAKRINNLNSQIRGGQANLEIVKLPYKLLLQAEIFLLETKVKFLERKYLLATIKLISYWILLFKYLCAGRKVNSDVV